MAEAKKGVVRIQIPPKVAKTHEVGARLDVPLKQGSDAADSSGVHMLMSKAVSARRDPLIVPLVGLLLAFSVISLIIQMLIAFS
jgi:hypothetical protein